MSEHLHFVRVEPGNLEDDDWRDSAKVTFECRGDEAAKCHQYPDCDCEYWDEDHDKEHPFAAHQECWMQGWFDSECGAVYDGVDAEDMDDNGVPRSMARSGAINAHFEYEYVSWEFATEAAE